MKLSKKTRALLAEFVAMTLFVFVGCGTAVSSQSMIAFGQAGDEKQDNSFLTAVAMAFGLGITVLAYSIAPISGGHINPAVTLSFVVLKKMSIVDGLMYWVSQFLGALLGAAIVFGCSTSTALATTPPFYLGSNTVAPGLGVGSAFLIEAMGTFLLVWTVMMTAVHKKSIAGNIAPIAIGWSVLLAHLVLIPFTGCGINPARSFGPHVVTAMAGAGDAINMRGIWVYYTAPFVGAVAAALMTSMIFGLDEEDEEEEEDALTKEPEEAALEEEPAKVDEEN